jgi:hypothetical protein
MKDLKKKLVAAVGMLGVSAIMLTGVSYAWFTLSTNPEVSNITANVSANENLEIALDNGYDDEAAVDAASSSTDGVPNAADTGNPYTWGNLLNLDDAFTSISDLIQIKPVAYDGGALKYPEYGTDGRVANVNNTLAMNKISDYSAVTTPGGGVIGYTQQSTGDVTSYDAFRVDYWLRSNEECTVSLNGTGVKRASSTNDPSATTGEVNGESGNGSYLEVTLASSTDNTKDLVTKYIENLVIRFNVMSSDGAVENSYYAHYTYDSTTSTSTSLKYTLDLEDKSMKDTSATEAKISLSANEAKKVQMYVYLDGATVTNADALLDDVGIAMNVQFQSSSITGTDGVTPGAMDGATATTTSTMNNGN